VSRALPAGIEVLRVATVHPAKEDCQGILALGNHHQVYMVGHQAIGQGSDRAVCQVHLPQFQIDTEIGTREEHPLAVTAALKSRDRADLAKHIEHYGACQQ